MAFRAASFRALAGALALCWIAAPLPAQEVVAGRPPMYARTERVRIYLSPLTLSSLRLGLDDESEFSSHEVEGVGISLGVDAIVHRHLALWANSHVGAVTGAEAGSDEISGRLSQVQGTFRSLAGGVAGVLSTVRLTGIVGLGVFAAGAEWEGRHSGSRTQVDTSATLYGIVSTVRLDYTLRNGFLIGIGVDAGGGIAAGSAARGARDPAGDWLVIYLPLGWTY